MAVARRNATVCAVLLMGCMSVLYGVNTRSSFGVSVSIVELDKQDKTSQSSDLELEEDISRQWRNNEVKAFGKYNRISRAKSVKKDHNGIRESTIFSTTQTASPTVKQPKVVNVWSRSWPEVNIGNCSHIEYMNRGRNAKDSLKAKEYPTTGLISFPGSGNTWMRHLIQQATGLWTGSVYKDQSLYDGGFQAELDDCNDKGSIVIKAHYSIPGGRSYCKFDRAIIVMRDPHRAVLSEFNWRTTSKHTGVADPRLYQSNRWVQHVIKRTDAWMSSTRTWIKMFQSKSDRLESNDQNPFLRSPTSSKTLLFVSYERVKENATREMGRIVQFLQLKTFRSNCMKANNEGSFRRKHTESESISCLFDKFDLKAIVEKNIRTLAAEVMQMGLGDITSEFEGPGGAKASAKCR